MHHPNPSAPGEDQTVSEAAGRERRTSEWLTQRARDLRRNMTPAEHRLWQVVRGCRLRGAKFRRQHPIGGYIADFYCHRARLVIELDGRAHASQAERDAARTCWIEAHGLTVLRFANAEIFDSLQHVIARIERAL